nr:hypothetical protein [uncultured Halomonas sp.]
MHQDVKSEQLVTHSGRRVLTSSGTPGMGGDEGIGSTTERLQGEIAAAIFAHASELDDQQLDDIIRWVRLYRTVDDAP